MVRRWIKSMRFHWGEVIIFATLLAGPFIAPALVDHLSIEPTLAILGGSVLGLGIMIYGELRARRRERIWL